MTHVRDGITVLSFPCPCRDRGSLNGGSITFVESLLINTLIKKTPNEVVVTQYGLMTIYKLRTSPISWYVTCYPYGFFYFVRHGGKAQVSNRLLCPCVSTVTYWKVMFKGEQS